MLYSTSSDDTTLPEVTACPSSVADKDWPPDAALHNPTDSAIAKGWSQMHCCPTGFASQGPAEPAASIGWQHL